VSSLGVGGSQFSVSGISLPITIAAGSSISFQVAFAPQTSGTSSSNVTFISNASNSPSVQALSGTATMPQHSVALSWNTSTSSGVVGYNVYRGTASAGPYSRINAAVVPAPFSTDSTVQGGQTYYYVTTAVDSSGMESSYSNQVQVLVPTP
jgi:fibronectin type 3 domain-containing protein